MTPLLEASEVRITANMNDIHISLLSKMADLNKIVKAQDKRIAALGAEIKSNLTQTPNCQILTPIKPPTSGANAVPVAAYRFPLLPEFSERTRVHLLPNSDFPALPKPAQPIAQPN
jgi:hypothetical protein